MIGPASRYLILGKNGMLGMDLQKAFHDRDFVALGLDELDITDEEALKTQILNVQPDVIINATAYKDVNKAEIEEELANQVNGYAVGKLAKICRDFGITLVHFSTDYVFDGKKRDGYAEEDAICPINAYGRSKALGEQLLMDEMDHEIEEMDQEDGKYYLIRTSYLFGKHGASLISKLLDNAKKGEKFKVINDQFSRPTYTLDLARQVKWLVESNEYESGIYHICNHGVTNWYDLAKYLLAEAGYDPELVYACSMNDWEAPAARPQFSVLLNTKLPELRPWQEAIKDYLS
jgi:dTDP-4-dehydrorhamnose reductase